jgi:hypothetical protein
MMQKVRMSVLAAVLVLAAAGASAQTFTTINGSPLKINVGADGSFQIYNSAVPGVGQVFPTSGELADMGIFAWIDGVLHAPNFAAHSGGSATGSLGTYTAWQPVSISQRPNGTGTSADPYIVSVLLAAPESDVRVNLTVEYVRGDNFFRLRTHIYSTTNTVHEIDAILGADIYLAGSDLGFFVGVPELNAVGGRSCDPDESSYNILMIPITPASNFTAGQFADVWRQIGENELDNNSEGTACVDNGAAVRWADIMASGNTSIELNAAVSFGAIPSAANFHGFSVRVDPTFISLAPGESAQLTINSTHNPALDFNAPLTFSAPNLPPGVTVTFNNNTVGAPGTGTVRATVTLDSTVFPQFYSNLPIVATGGGETHAGFFNLDVLCTPPRILGINQPQSTTVQRGQRATLRVTPSAGGLFAYQWYQGHAPLTGSPIAGSNSAELVTPPINEVTQFWVRVTNPCGSVNSLTATVVPTN